VTSDDHSGLEAAISRHFQGASWQRCQPVPLRHEPPQAGGEQEARPAGRRTVLLRSKQRILEIANGTTSFEVVRPSTGVAPPESGLSRYSPMRW
jgi:hypothetical protein